MKFKPNKSRGYKERKGHQKVQLTSATGRYTIYNGQTNQVSRKVVQHQPERHRQHQQNQEPTPR